MRKHAKVLRLAGAAMAIALGIALAMMGRERERMAVFRRHDAGRLMNFGLAFSDYADAHTGAYPKDLVDFAQDPSGIPPCKAYVCPSQPDRQVNLDDVAAGRIDYVYLGNGLVAVPETDSAAKSIVVMHTRQGILGGRINFLFLDGHVEGEMGSSAQEIAAKNGWILGTGRTTGSADVD